MAEGRGRWTTANIIMIDTSSQRGKPHTLRDQPKLCSVVMPCFNEAENVRPLYERLVKVMSSIPITAEFVFIENGSTDRTREELAMLAQNDARVRVLVLSRNFGYQGAISAGLAYARGDIVVVMDGDQQDPPEIIPALLEQWRRGYMVVYGTRAKREASWLYQMGYKLFYRLIRGLSYIDIPLDASDFALMDRRVVDTLNRMPERDRLIRGLRAYTGFRQTGIPYERPARAHGTSSYTFRAYIRFAVRGIFSFSYKPLEAIMTLALCTVGLAMIGIAGYLILFFLRPDLPRGFSTLILVLLALGGIQLLSTAIIGEYIGRIFEEIKQRPIFILDHEIHGSRLEKAQERVTPIN